MLTGWQAKNKNNVGRKGQIVPNLHWDNNVNKMGFGFSLWGHGELETRLI